MQATTQPAPEPQALLWAGRIVSALCVVVLLLSAVLKLTKAPAAVEGLAHFGFSDNLILGIGAVELACAIVFLIPRTSVLGAILLTGYLGGATAANVRVGEPFALVLVPVALGVLVWVGLYCRDQRLRALVLLASASEEPTSP
jgi:hypothetical protein